KPLVARVVVVVAGVTMNAAFALAVYAGLAYTGTLEPNNIATTEVDSVIATDLPPAAQPLASLRRGDRITTVNGDSVRTWGELQRGSERLSLAVVPERREEREPATKQPRVLGFVGVGAAYPTLPRPGVLGAIRVGWRETTGRAELILDFLAKLVTGRASVREL